MLIEDRKLSSYPWYVRRLLNSQVKKFGKPLLPTKAWGTMPILLILFNLFYLYLYRKKSPLSLTLKLLIKTRIAQINWCHFCLDYNTMTFIEKLGSSEKVDQLKNFRNDNNFSIEEKIALEYTEAMTITGKKVDKQLESNLKNHFTNEQIGELAALISFQNLSAKFNAGLNIPGQGLCKIERE